MTASTDLTTVEAAFAAWTTAVQTGDNDLARFRTDDTTSYTPPAQHLAPGEIRPPLPFFIPEDVVTRMEGTVAVVTFQYRDPNTVTLNRRTFIYRKTGDEWRVMHV